MTYNDICLLLRQRYEDGEARAVARYLLEVGYGLQMTDIICGATERLPADELQRKTNRLLAGEPVQYVVGTAEFCARRFHVAPGVLIPRPETEELCRLVEEDRAEGEGIRHILDIGTGSGCIAITLALNIPGARVEAWDISNEALAIAQENAKRHNADIVFRNVDILSEQPFLQQETGNGAHCDEHFSNNDITKGWDIIVSNPPYIVPSESKEMAEHVLEHEPGIALFVPQDNPLLFYNAIAIYAKQTLNPHGKLFFEINPLFCDQLETLLTGLGFADVTFCYDRFGRKRFATATKTV
ncbi:peptide chain release factor N(5)-glutamine methyltransferase [Prevotella koreensis]